MNMDANMTNTNTTPKTALNSSYLLPRGVLKLFQLTACFIVITLFAVGINLTYLGDSSIVLNNTQIVNNTISTANCHNFSLSLGIIFMPTTLILLIFFICNLTARAGGEGLWFTIDILLNFLATVIFFIGGIVTFYCSLYAQGLLFCLASFLFFLSSMFAVKAAVEPQKIVLQDQNLT